MASSYAWFRPPGKDGRPCGADGQRSDCGWLLNGGDVIRLVECDRARSRVADRHVSGGAAREGRPQ